jgi:asparagine synthase (glutamine-hydrolysing)
MGFPVPLKEWINGEANEFIRDIFSSKAASGREFVNNRQILKGLSLEPEYGRKIWGLLCLELWHEEFHDKEYAFKQLVNKKGAE